MENTFTYKSINQDGKTYHLLTANEYPGINMQIITFPEEEHDKSIEILRTHPQFGGDGWVIEHPERRDFAVIHAGGAIIWKPGLRNGSEICRDMKECMRNAAEWWHNRTK